MKAFTKILKKTGFDSLQPVQKIEFLTRIKESANMRGRLIETFLVEVLKQDADPIVRHEAAFVIAHVRACKRMIGSLALHALCISAEKDQSLIVRHEALEALGEFPEPQALKTIVKFITSRNNDLRATARISLAKIQQT